MEPALRRETYSPAAMSPSVLFGRAIPLRLRSAHSTGREGRGKAIGCSEQRGGRTIEAEGLEAVQQAEENNARGYRRKAAYFTDLSLP
jgi:hypothetical protein